MGLVEQIDGVLYQMGNVADPAEAGEIAMRFLQDFASPLRDAASDADRMTFLESSPFEQGVDVMLPSAIGAFTHIQNGATLRAVIDMARDFLATNPDYTEPEAQGVDGDSVGAH